LINHPRYGKILEVGYHLPFINLLFLVMDLTILL